MQSVMHDSCRKMEEKTDRMTDSCKATINFICLDCSYRSSLFAPTRGCYGSHKRGGTQLVRWPPVRLQKPHKRAYTAAVDPRGSPQWPGGGHLFVFVCV
jgi:hypothetical protein